MKVIFRFFKRFLLVMLVMLIGMLLMFYLLAPVYQFSGPVPFSGKKIYNPYTNMRSSDWKKYNFQVQSKAWMGITSGRDNTNTLIDSIYHQLGYDHVATSDYQKINSYQSEQPAYIPTYEHGYNAFKTHQVCIGAKKVLWTDLILWQSLSMKQWIIDLLQKDSRFVVLAHPLLRNGYTINDMKYLTNYQGIEVLNNLRVSLEHWDEALGSGQIAWIISNDDAHDVRNSNEVGRRFTLINSPSTNNEDIMAALEKGNAIGVDFYRISDEPMEEKIIRSRILPSLISVEVSHDSLIVTIDSLAKEIRFVGHGGKLLKTVHHTNLAFFVIPITEPYVRTEIEFDSHSVFYLNPMIRYSGNDLITSKKASINPSATLRLRILYFILALVMAYLYRRYRIKN
ncbi:MAG: hypothetical protein COW63_17480 [Bacteroidetes bacterium CG18_big_fil_WC_8_21_14_2_50_41_14]|nr:MAG: hypothetical protein COW63_17480 [Bacteroidetes bacterium CG18_big_fil_WC_8_21_14_2_50_41_14]PJB54856.1 MAG: hypothetical protein CO098_19370 [Bacteroidetes bacterium CG_4_9_14_3_um_filter_41_19]